MYPTWHDAKPRLRMLAIALLATGLAVGCSCAPESSEPKRVVIPSETTPAEVRERKLAAEKAWQRANELEGEERFQALKEAVGSSVKRRGYDAPPTNLTVVPAPIIPTKAPPPSKEIPASFDGVPLPEDTEILAATDEGAGATWLQFLASRDPAQIIGTMEQEYRIAGWTIEHTEVDQEIHSLFAAKGSKYVTISAGPYGKNTHIGVSLIVVD